MQRSKNPSTTPFYYDEKPLESGWRSREKNETVKSTATVAINDFSSGRVISSADNLKLRAFWLGGTKLFMNVVLFSRNIDAP